MLGIGPDEIEIKMFGGADMIMVRNGSNAWENQRVGRKNILKARRLMLGAHWDENYILIPKLVMSG
jgi:chemotaxis receptor (MCP) glutamine deamidase CheD